MGYWLLELWNTWIVSCRFIEGIQKKRKIYWNNCWNNCYSIYDAKELNAFEEFVDNLLKILYRNLWNRLQDKSMKKILEKFLANVWRINFKRNLLSFFLGIRWKVFRKFCTIIPGRIRAKFPGNIHVLFAFWFRFTETGWLRICFSFFRYSWRNPYKNRW